MALPINIGNLINAKTVESVRIEFKKGWNPYSILRTVCAFLNDIDEYGGGYIIVGIEEKGGSPILPLAGIDQKDIDNIQREFFKLCQDDISPKVFPSIEPIEFLGKWIIVIWVTPGEERPYSAANSPGKNSQLRIFVRHGAVTKEADKDQETRLRELATYKHYDSRVNAAASIDDMDLGLILSYLQEIKSQLYKEAQSMSLLDICLKMQIARGPVENIRPLNVGLMLFSKNPEKYFEGCMTNLIELEDEAGTEYTEKHFRGPVHVQIRQIMEYLSSNIVKQFVRKSATISEAKKYFNYPFQAIEEAVVNALYHRSYENLTPNEIRIYKIGNERRIEIISYPGPLPPIDENALIQLKITARNYRNLKLGDLLKNLGLAEKYATGIPTIINALDRNGSPKPLLSTDEARSHFLVLLPIHPDTPMEFSRAGIATDTILLSDIQQRILEKLIEEPATYLELGKVLKGDLKSEIQYLSSHELIGEKDANGITIYFITSKGRESLISSF